MVDKTVIPDEEATVWYTRFEASDAVDRLFEEAEVEETFDECEPAEVSRRGDQVTVNYYVNEGESDYIRIHGVFDEEEEELLRAELDDGCVAAPLAGHGVIWRYQDGTVERSEWVS